MDYKFLKHFAIPKIFFLFYLSFITGCSIDNYSINDAVPLSSVAWKPPSDSSLADTKVIPQKEYPSELPDASKKLSASELIDIALANNPETCMTWLAIKAAQAELGSQKGQNYPQLDILSDYSHSRMYKDEEKESLTEISLKWLIFDFGERKSSIELARYSIYAAGFSHNAQIQKVVLQVIETYLQYTYLLAIEKAHQASLVEAQQNLDAANERHKAGVATISDVLQAKTSLSQTMLSLQDVKGKILTIKGALATAIGIPANTPYEIEDIATPKSMETINQSVDFYIETALSKRPEMKGQQSILEKSKANIRHYEAKRYPSVSLDSSIGMRYYDGFSRSNEEYTAIFRLDIPVFKGFSRCYDIIKAKEEEKIEQKRLRRLEQEIILEVWSAYNDLHTASQKIKTTEDLLISSKKSYEAALGRYQEGVGDILELLSAQKNLENARASIVEAKTSWFSSLSRLSYASGMLWEPGKDIFKD